MDYFKKQYALVYANYDVLNNPTVEELIEVEKKIFELHSSIKKSKPKYSNQCNFRLYLQSFAKNQIRSWFSIT